MDFGEIERTLGTLIVNDVQDAVQAAFVASRKYTGDTRAVEERQPAPPAAIRTQATGEEILELVQAFCATNNVEARTRLLEMARFFARFEQD